MILINSLLMENPLKNKIFATRNYGATVNFTLLLVRVVFGLAMAFHGWGKIQSPFNWMSPESAVPGFFQFLAALSEFGGGIAIAIGLVTVLASLGVVFTMIVAVGLHAFVMGDPFVSTTGGSSYELAAVYLSLSLFILSSGPGKHSLDRLFFGVK